MGRTAHTDVTTLTAVDRVRAAALGNGRVMSFLSDLLGRFDEALDWPADPLLPDDDTVADWAPEGAGGQGAEARGVSRRRRSA
jgi:hypothetical protein